MLLYFIFEKFLSANAFNVFMLQMSSTSSHIMKRSLALLLHMSQVSESLSLGSIFLVGECCDIGSLETLVDKFLRNHACCTNEHQCVCTAVHVYCKSDINPSGDIALGLTQLRSSMVKTLTTSMLQDFGLR